jgi:predicted nucleotide-binding protein (sugar kinase/HSP70/actin superfamily)
MSKEWALPITPEIIAKSIAQTCQLEEWRYSNGYLYTDEKGIDKVISEYYLTAKRFGATPTDRKSKIKAMYETQNEYPYEHLLVTKKRQIRLDI